MKFIKSPFLNLVLIFLLCMSGFNCQAESLKINMETIGQDLSEDLKKALNELSDLQDSIAQEKIPLSQRLNGLEAEVIDQRQKLARRQRSADNQLVELAALKSEMKALNEEHKYISGLLTEYVRAFETRIHITELQLYSKMIQKTKDASENEDLSFLERSQQQMIMLNGVIDRVERIFGGDTFEGNALSPSGVLEKGNFVIVGPVAVFASEESEDAGLAQLQLGSPEASVIELESETTERIRSLVKNGKGLLPLDASLGNALKISATQETLFEHLKKGGPVMFPIIGLGIVALFITLFKWLHLSQNALLAPADLQLVLSHIKAGNIGKAKHHCKKIKGVVGEVLETAISHCQEKKEFIEEVLYEQMLRAKPALESMLPVIALTAATAPLLGLLGTVTGMINTFNMITIFGTGDPRMLSAGISEALITTKFGLVVAVPALICHAIISRKVKGILASMEQLSVGFINGVPDFEETKEAS